jgi:Holliday junction resolvase RusA-like endonuclease
MTDVTIPIRAVSVNCYYKKFRNHIVISKKGREMKIAIHEFLAENKVPQILGKVKVQMVFCLKYKRKIDVDNLLKGTIDSIKDIMIEDDDMIYDLSVQKLIGEPADSIRIIITPLEAT